MSAKRPSDYACHVSNQGKVAFWAGKLVPSLSDTSHFVTIDPDSTPKVVAEASLSGQKLFRRLYRDVNRRNVPLISLNNRSEVAFVAQPIAQPTALFAGAETAPEPVIAVGDELFDSTITHIEVDRKSLNAVGQIAFVAYLADGRSVVVRAEPDLVIEPDPFVEPDPIVEPDLEASVAAVDPVAPEPIAPQLPRQ
jgi:hypothetical protein